MNENGNMSRKTAVRYKTKVDSAGRVLIPAELRARLDVKPGASVTITAERSGRIVLESRSAAVRAAQDYFRSLAPDSEVWSDELIAERRREARREIAD
jgi:AbrB family looped-hinge helix DNA binding protein